MDVTWEEVVKLVYDKLYIHSLMCFFQWGANITITQNKLTQIIISAFILYSICRNYCELLQPSVDAT
jgi:hypothetical protein